MFTNFDHQYQLDLLRGNRVANEFKQLIVTQMQGIRIREPTEQEDVQDHIDVFINDVGYEIKAQKTNPDNPEFFVEDSFTIEFKNNAGYNGWIFGKATYIAQEFNSVFLCYKREDLLNWFLPLQSNYKPYTKPMNKSVVYYLPIKDCIQRITHFTIFKKNFINSINKNHNNLKTKPMNNYNEPFVQKPNTIILHNNQKKTDKHPDFRGTIAVEIDGVTHYRDVALWSKISGSGKAYFNGNITIPAEKNNAPEAVKIAPTAIDNLGSTKGIKPPFVGNAFPNPEPQGGTQDDLPF